MTDPFSITIDAIALMTTALSSVKALHDIINGIRDAPDALIRI